MICFGDLLRSFIQPIFEDIWGPARLQRMQAESISRILKSDGAFQEQGPPPLPWLEGEVTLKKVRDILAEGWGVLV